MCDEIQTGLGRTGTLFASDYEKVQPDVYILGKALGGGLLPVSAVVSTRKILGVFQPGEHGSTFGGNPLAAAVGRKVIQILRTSDIIDRANTEGEYFRRRLSEIHSPKIEEIRGRGLLIGVLLKPQAGTARSFCQTLLKEGMLCKDTHERVIRFAPPLVIERADLDWALERIAKVLA